ncbi:conserved membrane hypothetical protein [Candidatus Terasakiella magnetica]|nr:conserved membrane hypothetical protein [Candidatus Terasakiella magnetica]
MILSHLAYAAAWAVFGACHSLAAGETAKRALAPLLGRGYRLGYNLFAVALFIAVGMVGAWALGAEPLFALPAWGKAALATIHLCGWAVMLLAARYYDLGRLGGLYQLRHPDQPEDEDLHLGGPHRWVRHPLYAGAFLILWGGAVSPLGLATALWGSLYLLIGTACEEKRLLRRYGDAYAHYCAQVPAFIPWRGRLPAIDS